MKFQLIVTPSTRIKVHTDAPYGALYIANALLEEGHQVRIEDCETEKFGYHELSRRIKEYKPDVIGISAVIAVAYKYVKETTLSIKEEFPYIKIIVGGGLGSAADVLLNHTGIDIVVVGEGDITIKELARRIAEGKSYHDVAGIVFKEGNIIIKTPPRSPISDLNILKYPPFHLINMNSYLMDLNDGALAFRHYKKPDKRLFESHRRKKMFRIILSRGCIHRCTFCYRPTVGLRHFSFRYIFDYIEYLMDKFNISVFSFGDECFAPNKTWNWKFLEELNKRKLDILFQIMGMRVDTVDYEMLRAFKEAGCFQLFYGFESGSQRMLDIMNKRATVEQNIEVARWTEQAGIYTSPNFIFGMPGETTTTIKENLAFLKKLNYGKDRFQYAYPLAVPGTVLYDYAKLAGLIRDEDEYLSNLFYVSIQNLINTDAFINYTSEPIETVKKWPEFIRVGLLKYYCKNKVSYIINKYLRPGYISYSLKRFGLKKTLQDIWYHFVKKIKKVKWFLTPTVPETSPERDRYIEMVHRFIEKNREGASLEEIVKQLKNAPSNFIQKEMKI